MRVGIWIALIAGCAASARTSPSPPPPAPPPRAPIAARAPAAPPAPTSDWRCGPLVETDATTPSARLLARLPVCVGHVPGTTLELTAAPAPDRCGGIALEVTRDPDRPLATGGDLDEPWFFEEVMALEMPDPDDRATLDDWANNVALFDYGNASSALRARLRGDAPDAELVTVLARLVELERRFAESFVRARIATAYLEEPARTQWCDVPAHTVEGVVALMEADAARCRGVAARLPRGWWTDACADLSLPPSSR